MPIGKCFFLGKTSFLIKKPDGFTRWGHLAPLYLLHEMRTSHIL